MLDWTPQERDVGYLIVEMLVDKDPSGKLEFAPKHIGYGRYGDHLKNLYPRNQDIYTTVVSIFRKLKQRKELRQPRGDYTPYKLAENGYLFSLLSLRVRHQAVSYPDTRAE